MSSARFAGRGDGGTDCRRPVAPAPYCLADDSRRTHRRESSGGRNHRGDPTHRAETVAPAECRARPAAAMDPDRVRRGRRRRRHAGLNPRRATRRLTRVVLRLPHLG